jgi:NAD(P)-dependent dehydrogenase (short-subunit alcohol dehydrogenase family)
MDEQDPEIWQQVMQVNVNGTFFLTQALLPLLLKSDSGSLVFTSSSVGREGAQLGCLCRIKIRHRRHDAGAGRGVPEPPSARKLH